MRTSLDSLSFLSIEPSRFTKSLVGDIIVFVNRSLQS